MPDVTRGFRLLPAAHAVHLGAAAAAVGVRAAAGVAANAVKLRAARGAYTSIFSDRARLRFRRLVFGGDAAGSAARVALVTSAGGAALYCLIDPVPVSGRRRLLLFGLDDEMAMGDVAAAELFAARAGAFLPPGDARVRRVAAVMWQLVNRLEPLDAVAKVSIDPSDPSDAPSDPYASTYASSATTHPLIDGARRWTVHVVDDPSVDAYTCPGGHVFVHAGVLDLVGARDDSALAFILAHEMGHALCRHGAEKATLQLLSSAADAASWAAAVLAGADYFGGAFTAAALAGAESAVTLAVTLPNSRDMEREADLVGVRLMARACFDPNGAARAFRKIEAARRSPNGTPPIGGAPGAPGSPGAPGAPGAPVAGDGVSRLEAYLSTHPLDAERARNASAHARAVSFRDSSRDALCASFRDALARFGVLKNARLPRNASAANRGAVAVPSDAWRARFIRNVDAKIAGSPRGVTGALGVAAGRGGAGGKRAEEGPVGSGPVGRFDRGRLVALAGGGGDGKNRDGKNRSPGSRRNGILQTVSCSRAWRGPVRRARETASAGDAFAKKKAAREGGAAERRGGADEGSGDAEAGETVLAGDGRLVDRGARRAVRGVASRTTRQWVEPTDAS